MDRRAYEHPAGDATWLLKPAGSAVRAVPRRRRRQGATSIRSFTATRTPKGRQMDTMLWDRFEELAGGCGMIADPDPIDAVVCRRLNHTRSRASGSKPRISDEMELGWVSRRHLGSALGTARGQRALAHVR